MFTSQTNEIRRAWDPIIGTELICFIVLLKIIREPSHTAKSGVKQFLAASIFHEASDTRIRPLPSHYQREV